MASTHGRKPKPLPNSFEVGLRELGFRQIEGEVPALFRHPKHPALFVSAATSNIPGDPYVIARWGDDTQRWMLRIHVDELLKELRAMVAAARGVNRIVRFE